MVQKYKESSMLDGAFIFKAIVQADDRSTFTLFYTDIYPAGAEWDIDGILTGVSLDDCMVWLEENKYLSSESCKALKMAIVADLEKAIAEEAEECNNL